ncbi:hypothetical protein [Leifsonia sp. NPDC080035]|uniref:DUF559 domain-containing protein n=1 Tax=Leifsonia sp. NPDC080035 TaxID=3143936 RepID=A0AAU7GAA9_9MICO
MKAPLPLPTGLRSAPFSTSDAAAAAVVRSRLRRSDLVAPYRGTRAHAASFDGSLLARCRTYAADMPPSRCFSHATAARLHGIVLPSREVDDRALHVSNLRGGRAPRGPGVIGHTISLHENSIASVDGLAVFAPSEVWCQLGARLTVAELVVAADSCLRRAGPLSTLGELRLAVARWRGRRGVDRLRAAIPLARERTDSAMETLLRLAIVGAGLPEPIVNRPIQTAGRTLHGDLVYPRARLVIEYDGDHHRADARQ